MLTDGEVVLLPILLDGNILYSKMLPMIGLGHLLWFGVGMGDRQDEL